jgi:hypothetical protein
MSGDNEHNGAQMIEVRGVLRPSNPAPGAKWQARQGLTWLNLNGVEHDVMECFIDRANRKVGYCWPSEDYISGWTGRAPNPHPIGLALCWAARRWPPAMFLAVSF